MSDDTRQKKEDDETVAYDHLPAENMRWSFENDQLRSHDNEHMDVAYAECRLKRLGDYHRKYKLRRAPDNAH